MTAAPSTVTRGPSTRRRRYRPGSLSGMSSSLDRAPVDPHDAAELRRERGERGPAHEDVRGVRRPREPVAVLEGDQVVGAQEVGNATRVLVPRLVSDGDRAHGATAQ